MSFATFKQKWLGKRVDYDKVYGFQCVDLIKQYLHEEKSLRPGAWGNAIHYWTRPNKEILAKFDKVSGSAAKSGDVVIFKTLGRDDFSGEGHIGVATGRLTATEVEVIEQNGSTGSGDGLNGNAVRTRFIARSRVAGLLRPKATWLVTEDVKGKTVYLKPHVSSWRVYKPGTRVEVARLNPKKFGGLEYKIVYVDSLPQRVIIDTQMFGRVSLPVDKDAEIR